MVGRTPKCVFGARRAGTCTMITIGMGRLGADTHPDRCVYRYACQRASMNGIHVKCVDRDGSPVGSPSSLASFRRMYIFIHTDL